MVCTYNSVFFSHSKEWSSGTSLHDEPWKRYAKRNKLKPQRTNIMWLHLYEISRKVTFIKIKFISGCQGLGGRKEWGASVSGYEVSFWCVENILEIDNTMVVQLWIY